MKLEKRGLIINPDDLGNRWMERISRHKINEIGIHPGGGAETARLLENSIAFHSLKSTKKMYEELNAKGTYVEYDAHVLSWLLPRSLFSKYPEWFRMNENGERKPDFNMCASSEDALDYVTERSAILARLLDTGYHRYAYWIDDVKGYACRCEKCRELSPADQAMRIINAMLKGVRMHDPVGMVPYLAYQDTLAVPKCTRPLEGIYLEYAPISRDIHAPICDETNDKNKKESAAIRDLVSFFGKKDARILEYWIDNSLFSNWKRPPQKMKLDAEVMRKDVQFYYECGFSEMTAFACFLGDDYYELFGEPDMEDYGKILLGE